jgi:hypothetical protein
MVGRTARGVGDNAEPVVGKSLEEGAIRLLRRAADEGAADEMYDRTALASELGQQHVARADPLPPPCRPRRWRCVGALAVRLAGPRRGGLAAWRGVASRHGRGEGEQRDAASEHAGGGDYGRREHRRVLVATPMGGRHSGEARFSKALLGLGSATSLYISAERERGRGILRHTVCTVSK